MFPSLSTTIPCLLAATSGVAPVGTEAWRQRTIAALKSLDVAQLDQDQWFFVGSYFGARALFVLVLMTLAWTASSWASSVVQAAMSRVKFDETLTKFSARFVRWIILLMVALMCLSKFGVETASFAAVLGAAGLAIGLAFQGTLSNFAAGAMLLIFRPFKVGDTVNVAGYQGKVYEIELFTTEIDTPDNRRIIVPNSSIFGAVIENITHHALRRTTVTVGTAYSADIDATRRTLERAARSVPQIVAEPAAEVVLVELGGSSINWSINAWARNDALGAAKQGLLRAVKMELDAAGIGIPFPQLDIHLGAADAQPAAQSPPAGRTRAA
jgi:small conductance mechanosensitive channel